MSIFDDAWKAATESVGEIDRAREKLANGIGDRASQMTRDAMQQIGDISQSVEKRLQQFQQPKQSTHERPTTRERVMKMMEGIDNEHRLSRSSSYSSIDSQASTVRSSSRSQSPTPSVSGSSSFDASQASTNIGSRSSSPAPSSRAPSQRSGQSMQSSASSQRSTTSGAPTHGSTTSRAPSQGPSMYSKASSAMSDLYNAAKGHRADAERVARHGGTVREAEGMTGMAVDFARLMNKAPNAAAQAVGNMYGAAKELKGAAQSADIKMPNVSGAARHAASSVYSGAKSAVRGMNSENAREAYGAAREVSGAAARGAAHAASSAARGARSAAQGINPENAREAARAAGIVGGAAARGAAHAASSAYRGARGAASNMTSANAGNAARAAREVGKSLAQSGVSAAKSAFSAAKYASKSIAEYRTDGVNFGRGSFCIGK